MLFAASVFVVIAIFEIAAWLRAALVSGSWFGSREDLPERTPSGGWRMSSGPIPPRPERSVELFRLTCFGGQSRESTMAPDSRSAYMRHKSKKR